jgi:WD40 repeat protein
MQYVDFDLEIGPRTDTQGQEYPVAVVRSPAGEARAVMRFPFDEAALSAYHETIQTALGGSGQERRQAGQTVQDFGQRLFEALFAGDIRSCYDVSQREAGRKDDQGLRVKLRIQAPELAALPWEFLYDARQGEYVCLSRQTPLVRYLELPQSAQPLPVKPPLRILCMIASPGDQAQLDIEREQGRIQEALSDLQGRGLVELTWLEGQTWRDLQRAMRGGPWHVFHFIGHGGFDPRSEEGVLALADEQGHTSLLTATQMGHLLADHRSLRLALLNACEGAQSSERDLFSSTAATLARRGIPAVVAMQYEITDRAAIEYTRAFYEAISDGMPVDAAVSEARKAITFSIANTLEWATPVLYLRSPDSALFEIAKEKRHKPAATTHKPKADAPAREPVASKLGELVCTYSGHDNWVMRVAWSPDGTLITSSQKFDSPIQVWEAEFGAHVRTYEGHTDTAWDAPWSPDGTRIASCSEDGTVQIWEAATGKMLYSYSSHKTRVLTVAWAPDGKRVASADDKGQIHIWLAGSGAVIKAWSAHGDSIGALDWSPDGTRLVSGSSDGNARVWDAASGDLIFEFDRHQSTVFAVAWLPDKAQQPRIASTGEDGTIQVWTPTPGSKVISAGDGEQLMLSLAWSPDGKRIATASDETVIIWDAERLDPIFTYKGHEGIVRAVAWSPDGTRIASASNDSTAQVWRAE